ncbi:hypothetical protein H0H93_015262 [Arthromyces matolae]|nr:hypothetical protein H0H93_015262 [Arthromyces matolae]
MLSRNPIPLEAYKSTLSRRGIKSTLQARENHAGSVDQATPLARVLRRRDNPLVTDPTATQGSPKQALQNLGSPDTALSASSASSMATDKSSVLDPTSSGPTAPPDATNLAGSTAVDPNAKSPDGTKPKEENHHHHHHHPHHHPHPHLHPHHHHQHEPESKEGEHKKHHHQHKENHTDGQDKHTSPSVDHTAPSGDTSSLKVSPSGPDGSGIPPSDLSGGNAGLKAADPLSGAGAGATGSGSGGPPTNTPISSPLSTDPQAVASPSLGGPTQADKAVNLPAAKTADSPSMGGPGLSGAAAMSASGTPPPVNEGAPAA